MAFEHEMEVLRRAWVCDGISALTRGRGTFVKLRHFYFVVQEFEEVLQALRSLPSLASGRPVEAVKYMWRMNEFLLVYRDNYIPNPSTRFLSGGPVDIQEYDTIQAQIASELHRILGSPIAG
jgi:hypothetical protein